MDTSVSQLTVFEIDYAYDRSHASGHDSRFVDHLLARREQVIDETQAFGALGWALAVWRIATSPVMSPGFVNAAPGAGVIDWQLEHDGEKMVLTIDIASERALPFARASSPIRTADWQDAVEVADVAASDDELRELAAVTLESIVLQANAHLRPVMAALRAE